MKKIFDQRTFGFYLDLAACAAALIGAVGLIAADMGDRTFSWITVGLAFAGIAFGCLNCVTDLAVAPLLSAVCFGCALSWHLYVGLPTLSDIWNGVNFIGGNARAVILFGAFFAAAAVFGIAASFMSQRRHIRVV